MIHPSTKFLDFETVLQRIDVPPPGEMAARISALPKAGVLPGPATTWLFINLMLYRARQRWARKQLQQHLPDFFVGGGEPAPLSEGERHVAGRERHRRRYPHHAVNRQGP